MFMSQDMSKPLFSRFSRSFSLLAAGALILGLSAHAGPSAVLPTGRRVTPVGRLAPTPNFPTAVATLRRDVVVLTNGAARTEDLLVYGRRDGRLVLRARLRANKFSRAEGPDMIARQSFFQGLATGADGTIYAAGGFSDDVLAVRYRDGMLRVLRRYPLHFFPFPARQFPYLYQGPHHGTKLFYPDAVALGPRGDHLYVTGLLSNALARINLESGRVRYVNAGSYPYALAFAEHGRTLVVSDWGGQHLRIYDPRTLKLTAKVALGPHPNGAGLHPTALAVGPNERRVYVALSNVDRIDEIDLRRGRVVRTFADVPYRDAPYGSYPSSLAVRGHVLYVANAGNDDVALFDLRNGRTLGFVPTGWYPTSLALTGHRLVVVAAKGLGSGPNIHHQWVGDFMHGLVQSVSLARIRRRLDPWTHRVLRDDLMSADQRRALARLDARLAPFLRHRIKTVVFILRENKTFDEDFGRYRPAGRWADPHLDLYDRRELPNLYRLAHRYTLFVNFMADGEVTAQGHQWTTGASDSDFVQRTWPMYYSNRGLSENPGWTTSLVPGRSYGWAGVAHSTADPYAIYTSLRRLGPWSNPWMSYPAGLYLFNNLLAHHVPFIDFGEFLTRNREGHIANDLLAHADVRYPGWDRFILDTDRERAAVAWLKKHHKRFPRFIYIWLPDDHTAGRTPCYYTPDYYVWNNDLATARLLAYLSRTPQWKHMAVFITEDDAQSGADHINAHRTLALLVSPWAKRGKLVTRLYSQVSIVRTMELILGIPPMSQWDANARPITGVWRRKHPDDRPVRAIDTHFPVAYNPGSCPAYTLERRLDGTKGRLPAPRVPRPKLSSIALPPPRPSHDYGPTTLLKVPGPVQLREEWIASKGLASYERLMRYLRRYARRQHEPLASFLAH
jgi:DNA-binding beta-propeller fold protein YncE